MTIEIENSESIDVIGPSLFVLYQPDGLNIHERTPGGIPGRSISILCKKGYIQAKILAGNISLPLNVEQLISENKEKIESHIVPLSSRLLDQAMDFFRFEYKSKLDLVYAEAKARETLCVILQELSRSQTTTPCGYSLADKKRLKEAYDILSLHFTPPPTIAQLARMLGSSETKLKVGFKDLYGVTLFDFAHHKRMQHAMKLLLDQRLPVGTVSELSGYNHQATFATAFKSFFGIRPKDVKKVI